MTTRQESKMGLLGEGSRPGETTSVERGKAVHGCAEPMVEETTTVARLSMTRWRGWPRKPPLSKELIMFLKTHTCRTWIRASKE